MGARRPAFGSRASTVRAAGGLGAGGAPGGPATNRIWKMYCFRSVNLPITGARPLAELMAGPSLIPVLLVVSAAATPSAMTMVDLHAMATSSVRFGLRDRRMEVLRRPRMWADEWKNPSGPPVGAVYKAVLNMPLIGHQTFMLEILRRQCAVDSTGCERGLAQITLAGAMNLSEPAEFTIGEDGRIDLELNDATIALLRRMRTRIRSCTYCQEEDRSVLVVAPPLVPAIHVRMARQHGPDYCDEYA